MNTYLLAYTASDHKGGGAVTKALRVRALTAADAVTQGEIFLTRRHSQKDDPYYKGIEFVRPANPNDDATLIEDPIDL